MLFLLMCHDIVDAYVVIRNGCIGIRSKQQQGGGKLVERKLNNITKVTLIAKTKLGYQMHLPSDFVVAAVPFLIMFLIGQ